jgi:catechol 2,3-dioxygenase-like lactoylglutathione lyase family enzyme
MTGSTPQRSLAHVALVVRDYDEAIDFYTRVLGFLLVEDTHLTAEKRWVIVAPSDGASLLLAKASNDEQRSRIGDQTGGRVFLFLHTDDFHRDHRSMTAHGVKFVDGPREEAYGTVGVFEDLYGNRWDLIERKTSR